jgi:hypothetical protein
MARNVICISRALAAGGEDIGQRVAQSLGHRYADEEIIVRAAEQAGVPKETVEQAEHPPGLIGRVLENLGRTPIEPEMWVGGAMLPNPPSAGYEGLIKQVVVETAGEGNVVIVAHGASMALAGRDGVLRVLVTGSPAVRAEHIVQHADVGAKDAARAIEDSDKARREYLRRFYDIREESPLHYDLTLNTDAISPETAARIICEAAKA